MAYSDHAALSPDRIDLLTGRILRQWRRRLRRRGDDCARSGDRGESERLLVAALLRASTSADDDLLPGLAAAASCYGAGQRRARLDPGGLCDELAALRQLVWKQLKEEDPSVQSTVDRILRFDRALSIVMKAAVTAGYSPSPSGVAAGHEAQNDGPDRNTVAMPNGDDQPGISA